MTDSAALTYSEQREHSLGIKKLAAAVLGQAIRDALAEYRRGIRVREELADGSSVYKNIRSIDLLQKSEPYLFLARADPTKGLWCSVLGINEALFIEWIKRQFANKHTVEAFSKRVGHGNTTRFL